MVNAWDMQELLVQQFQLSVIDILHVMYSKSLKFDINGRVSATKRKSIFLLEKPSATLWMKTMAIFYSKDLQLDGVF